MPEDRNIYRILGELTGEVKGLRRDVQEDREASKEYRSAVRKDIQDVVLRITHVETETATLRRETSSISRRVDKLQAVTDDVQELRAKAAGAGLLGHWLVRIGIGVVTLGGWLYAAYAWVVGRPPP